MSADINYEVHTDGLYNNDAQNNFHLRRRDDMLNGTGDVLRNISADHQDDDVPFNLNNEIRNFHFKELVQGHLHSMRSSETTFPRTIDKLNRNSDLCGER